jgi:hypothetical protein
MKIVAIILVIIAAVYFLRKKNTTATAPLTPGATLPLIAATLIPNSGTGGTITLPGMPIFN